MRVHKWLTWFFGLVMVFVLSIAGGGYFYLRSTVAGYDGIIISPKVSGKVEIIRDDFGMPHIYAANDEDAAFALGYCTAQDRLFQIDIIRRSVRGRMAEIIGNSLVDVDRMFRTITAAKSPEQMLDDLPPDVRSIINAYTAGINHYLSDKRKKLSFEFAILGYEPEKWVPADCMTVLYYMAWALNFSFDTELLRAAVAEKVGEPMAGEVFIDYPTGAPSALNPTILQRTAIGLIDVIYRARFLAGASLPGASNNWVVSGKKSVTGMPLLANDMHLGLVIPGIWYEAHLVTPRMNVSGVVVPGTPLVVAGANEHVAWGFTNVMADETDFYIEQINPDDSTEYAYKGGWEKLEIRHDTIKIRNGDPVSIDIRLTRHGPIINDIIPSEDSIKVYDSPIAMRWTITDFGREAEALYLLNRAENIDNLEYAASMFKCPGQNWVYADDQGNIGFTAAVGIPVRDGFDGRRLLSGFDGRYEWSGYVPFEQQPHLRNPETGWIATANNRTVENDYPHYISHCYGPPDRLIRISRMIREERKLSVNDFKRMQADDYLVMAEDWVPAIVKAVSGKSPDKLQSQVLAKLRGWDYHTPADRPEPAIFHVIFQKTVEKIFKDELGEELYAYFLSEGTFTIHKAMKNLLDRGESSWFDKQGTADRERLDDLLAESFVEAIDYLSDKFGDDINEWQWGKLHTMTLYHPVGRNIPVLKSLMNVGPCSSGSSTNCVNAAIYKFSDPYIVAAAASQRHIFDLSDRKDSWRIIPGGISGNFMSRHYKDQFELWRRADYRPFVLDREGVEKNVAYRMEIILPDSLVAE